LAVLDGEVAVPCSLQSAIAGSNPVFEAAFCSAGSGKWCWRPGPVRRRPVNPARSGRKQR